MIARTPAPPYYAVIFTSILPELTCEYVEEANKMMSLAETQKGFLGIESARNDIGLTVSYWKSLEDIKKWKQNAEHLVAQKKGKYDWYSYYKTRICRVERDYEVSHETP